MTTLLVLGIWFLCGIAGTIIFYYSYIHDFNIRPPLIDVILTPFLGLLWLIIVLSLISLEPIVNFFDWLEKQVNW